MTWAYYNEFDPYAAAWLQNLINAGRIAPGIVDNRSILDVKPDDLRGFTQSHFFAGIGVWSYALRLAGWPDDRPAWTGSCPCQPFSVAGSGGGFGDERHLWPYWHFLIDQRRPPVVFGEQVEAAIKHGWLDLVQSDMEGIGYAFGAVGLPAAGVGAPHIRQRLWFVADRMADANQEQRGWRSDSEGLQPDGETLGWQQGHGVAQSDSASGRMGDDDARLEGLGGGHQTESGRVGAIRPVAEAGELGGVADDDRQFGQQGRALTRGGDSRSDAQPRAGLGSSCRTGGAGPTNGHWRDADWLFCRDGKWRPVEPGTFPLAYGAPARVGRLRAYGNAIVPQVAAEVIRVYMECRP